MTDEAICLLLILLRRLDIFLDAIGRGLGIEILYIEEC